LYAGDGEDAPVLLDSAIEEPGENDMLWVDLDLDYVGEVGSLWEKLGLEGVVSPADHQEQRPKLVHHNGILELWVSALGDGPGLDPMMLRCVVGPNFVVTLHEGELDLVDEFNKPFHGDTRLGDLSGPAFLSLVLDWQISGYMGVIDELQGEIDELDEKLLTTPPDEADLLRKLQELRMRVRGLRNALSPHREVLGLLSHPRSEAVVGAQAADDYKRLEDRLQQAIDSVDTAREMIVGSFDIYMTRTAQATNDIMKRLTLVSVLLLPAGVIAGVMGMNFKVPIFDWSWMFWVVIGAMVGLASLTLLVAKLRDWL
jgi:Mg2+ and Co2+ transporter CorA